MTDRTTEALRRTMQAIVDVAPEAPDVAPIRPTPRKPAPTPLVAAAAAFVLVLVVGAALAIVTDSAPEADVAAPESATIVSTVPPSTTWPPTTAVASGVLYDTAAAITWGDAVTEALVSTGWDEPVIAAFETDQPFARGGTVTALVGETDWSRLVVDLQGWAEGEYRTDPVWQSEVGGSTDPGRETPRGTLFTSTGDANTVILVNEHGLLTLQMVRDDDQVDRMEALATALAGAMETLATGN